MRGGVNNQVTAVLKVVTKIGVSRHEAKAFFGGKSLFIHSIGTFQRYYFNLLPFIQFLKRKGIRDLEQLTSGLVEQFLSERLNHHVKAGNSRQTFKGELAALAMLERGLTLFSQTHRQEWKTYCYIEIRKQYSKMAKELPLNTALYSSRAINNPEGVIQFITNKKHKLMAQLQWESGSRTEGVGAPVRGSNPLTITNFGVDSIVPGTDECSDPVTGELVAPLKTKEKGGKEAFKFCSLELRNSILNFMAKNGGKLESGYPQYLKSVNQALELSGQASKGMGTHSLRFAFARRRYAECLIAGLSDEHSKHLISMEMSHNRADITEIYLR